MASMASVQYHEKKLAGLLHVVNQITNEDGSASALHLRSLSQLAADRKEKMETLASPPLKRSPRSSPLESMKHTVQKAGVKRNGPLEVQGMVLAFLKDHTGTLANLKFKLLTRWAGWVAGRGQGGADTQELGVLGERFSQMLRHIDESYKDARARQDHLEGRNKTNAVPQRKKTPEQEILLRSEDVKVYLSWVIPQITAQREAHPFLMKVKWLAFTSLKPIIDRSLELRERVKRNWAERTLHLGVTDSASLPLLPTTLEELKLRIQAVQLYGSEGESLELEGGHAFLQAVLRLFPLVFQDLAQSEGLVRAASWVSFDHFPVTRDPVNVVQQERLRHTPLDPSLELEAGLVKQRDCETIMGQLRLLAGQHSDIINTNNESKLKYANSLDENLKYMHQSRPRPPGASHGVGSNINAGATDSSLPRSPQQHSTTPDVIPRHMLHAMLCLRLLHIRSLKRRCFGILNYCRSLERRLVLDDHGFGFADERQFDTENIIRSVGQGTPSPLNTLLAGVGSTANTNTTGSSANTKGASADKKPRTHKHADNVLPTDYTTKLSEFMAMKGVERRNDSYKWKGVGTREELHVLDCSHIPIAYDAAIEDMRNLEYEVSATLSYVIHQHQTRASRKEQKQSEHEQSQGKHAESAGLVDRWGALVEIYELELEFLGAKQELMARYLECYEHAIGASAMHKFGVKMLELNRLRPHLDLQPEGVYHAYNYRAHTELLLSKARFYAKVIKSQVQREKDLATKSNAEDWRTFLSPVILPGPDDNLPDKKTKKQPPSYAGEAGAQEAPVFQFPEGQMSYRVPSLHDIPVDSDRLLQALVNTSINASGVPDLRVPGNDVGLLDVFPSTEVLLSIDDLLEATYGRICQGNLNRPSTEWERLCLQWSVTEEACEQFDLSHALVIQGPHFSTIAKLKASKVLSEPRHAVQAIEAYHWARTERRKKTEKQPKRSSEARDSSRQSTEQSLPAASVRPGHRKSAAPGLQDIGEGASSTGPFSKGRPGTSPSLLTGGGNLEARKATISRASQSQSLRPNSSDEQRVEYPTNFNGSNEISDNVDDKNVESDEEERRAGEALMVAVACNITEGVHLVSALFKEIDESALLLSLYHSQARIVGLQDAPTLVLADSAKSIPSSQRRKLKAQKGNLFRLAVVECLELLPLKLKSLKQPDEYIRMDPIALGKATTLDKERLQDESQELKKKVDQHEAQAKRTAESWLQTVRRVLLAQMAHKHCLATAVTFHTALIMMPEESHQQEESSREQANQEMTRASRERAWIADAGRRADGDEADDSIESKGSSDTDSGSELDTTDEQWRDENDEGDVDRENKRLGCLTPGRFLSLLVVRQAAYQELVPGKTAACHASLLARSAPLVPTDEIAGISRNEVTTADVIAAVKQDEGKGKQLANYLEATLEQLSISVLVLESHATASQLLYMHLHVLPECSPFSCMNNVAASEAEAEAELRNAAVPGNTSTPLFVASSSSSTVGVANAGDSTHASELEDEDGNKKFDGEGDGRGNEELPDNTLLREEIEGTDVRDLYTHLNHCRADREGAGKSANEATQDGAEKVFALAQASAMEEAEEEEADINTKEEQTGTFWKAHSPSDFMWRIPCRTSLLPLITKARQSSLSLERMHLDIIARQLLVEICELAYCLVCLEDLSRHTVTPSSGVHEKEDASKCALYADLPAGVSLTMIPSSMLHGASLSFEQQKKMATIVKQHLPLEWEMKYAGAHLLDIRVSRGRRTDICKSKIPENLSNVAAGTSLMYLEDLLSLLDTKRMVLRQHLMLFVRHHHESCVTLGRRASAGSGNRDERNSSSVRPDLGDEMEQVALKVPAIRAHRHLIRGLNALKRSRDRESVGSEGDKAMPPVVSKVSAFPYYSYNGRETICSGSMHLNVLNNQNDSPEREFSKTLATIYMDFLPSNIEERKVIERDMRDVTELIFESSHHHAEAHPAAFLVPVERRGLIDKEMANINRLENFGFRFVQWEEAYTEHPLADFEPKLIPSDLDGQTKAMPLKVVHEIDFLAICAKQARLQKLADFMEGALQLARHFDAYCSFHLSPSAPKHSIVQHKEHHAFASDSTEQILSIDENAYSSMMGMFSNSVLVQLHHLNQCRKDPAATLVLPARSLHQKLQRVRARHVEHTTGAYFQGGPLSSFQTFTAYALSLMPDGQANHINVTTHDLQVTMIRKALAELKSLLCFVVEVPRSPTGHIDGLAENISDVPVIAHMMQTTLAPHRQSLDQVVDLPTDGDLFVIGSSDLERAFNSMARDVNALSTSCRRSNMESTLGQNADTNELLYRVQKENDLLLVDIGKRGGERQVALDFDVALNLQSLLLQRSNLTFRCSELRETLRAEEVVVSMRARRHFGTMSMRMAKRLRAIKAKFEEYKEELSAHIITASRSLKQQVVLNLQGEYSQRSLMALLEEQKTQMSRSMVQVDELEEARRQSAGLKHHLLRLQTHMSKSMRDGRSEDVRHVNKAVETLHGHSDKEHELQLLKQELERSVILSAQAEHARICATQNLHALRSKLERSTTEKRALLKCRAENNARFQELAEKGRKYDMMTSTSIRQVQEAAVGSQKEGAEEFEAAEENALSSSLYETEQEQVEREVQSQLLFTQNMESLRMQLQARQREKDGALLELARHESTHQHTPLERSPEDMSWNPGQGTHERTHPWNKALFTAHAAKYRNKVQELQRENQVLEELMGRRKQARRPELPVSRPHTTAERQIGTPMRGEQNRVSRTAHSDAEWNRSHKGISSARGVRRRQDGEVSRLLHTSPRAAFSPMASVDLDEYFARQSTIERLPRFAGVVQQPAGTGSFMESGLLSLAMAQSTPADQVRVQKRFRSTRETARVVKDSMERKIAGPYAQPQASRVARPPQKPAVAPQTSRPYINLNLEASSGAGDGRHYRSVANSNRAVVESALAIHRFENKSSIR